ncbi:MAG: 5-methyltetrahydrofolate corrinoid/iron sulfur protein methyltransferase [Phycisphaerales bacterium]|nr:5-methyltetrahydrofolate corrinoid/iron sulfur protein methyltransferase [Phycisphaerales bacterium]
MINSSFARAARAWKNRDVAAYAQLAKLQADLGADFLTLNIDGTQSTRVTQQDMYDLLPDLIPAIQEATSCPIAFDNPSAEFHRRCLAIYDFSKSGRPIVNSVAASRHNLDEMFELVRSYDTMVIGMASEKFVEGGGAQCLCADDVYAAAQELVHMLREKAGRSNDQIILDPGLAPVGADTYGLVNMGLDAIKRIRANPDLAGVHLSVGLTNFSFGMPKAIRENVESAYLTLAVGAGLDYVLGNPEKNLHLLPADDRFVIGIAEALEAGRPTEGETQEEAGFRQAMKVIELFDRHHDH